MQRIKHMTTSAEPSPQEQASTRPNPSIMKKHAARLAAVQCVYSRMLNPSATPQALIEWQLEQQGEDKILPVKPDKKLLQGILFGVDETEVAISKQLERILDERWTGARMPNLMRAILLCAAYETIYTPKLRPAIIIDQYVGVADAFLDDSDISFVNGVLQEIMRDLRPLS